VPSREMRRMQKKVGVEKKRAAMRKAAPKKKGGGAPKKKRVGLGQFLKEVRAEMRKVSWPARNEVLSYTVVVIVVVTITTVFVVLVDYGFSKLVHYFIVK